MSENWATSEFDNNTPPEEPAPRPPPSGKAFWYVAGALVLVLFIILNSTPSYELVIDPRAREVAPPVHVPLEPAVESPAEPPAEPIAEPFAIPSLPAEPVDPARPSPAPPDPGASSPAPPSASLSDLVSQLRPAVVYVFYEQGGARFSGTGFVLDDAGRIATNAHVVQFTDRPSVMTSSGRSYPARVVARAANEDLALVQADLPPEVPAVRLGDSERVRLGDEILVMGYPLGLFSEVTVTPGIVGSFRRHENRVQLSMAINKGNSGGPVFSRATGEVVAVVVSKHAVGEGMGFSIPVNTLRRFLEENGR
jgi:S1-C subfamily serine protease